MTEKKNILLSNDDGIDAPGIRALGKALLSVANVYVCAPDSQRSAAAHSITMTEPVGIREVTGLDFATRAFRMTGTPVDCVKIGWGYLKDKEQIPIHYVYSGINLGANLGTDTLYSGTVGAAVEGYLNGLSSVAVSIASWRPKHYEYVCELALELFHELERHEEAVLYNLNAPDLPKEEVKGVRITRLGVKGYHDQLHEHATEEGYARYYFYGAPVLYKSKNVSIDVIANQEGYASITPLHPDMTDYDRMEELRHLER